MLRVKEQEEITAPEKDLDKGERVSVKALKSQCRSAGTLQ